MPAQRTANHSAETSARLGFEAQFWQAANALRGSMDVAEYKHVVLGLIFLKYISDAFEHQHARIEAERGQGASPRQEDPEPFEQKMRRLTAKLEEQFRESAELEKAIAANLERLGFDT
jgi:type I restriction enzyme M protein